MNARNKRIRRTIRDILLELVGLALLTMLLWNVQSDAALARQESNSRTKLNIAQQRMVQNDDEANDNLETYDAFSQAKVDTVAYCFARGTGTADLAALCQQWGIQSYYLLNADGSVERSNVPVAERSLASFTDSLQTLTPVTLNESVRYYLSRMDDGRVLIGGRDMIAEKTLLTNLRSPARALCTIKVGTTGYVMAINEADQTIAYHPNETLIGMDAAAAGYDPALLPDGFNGWSTINGAQFYCVSRSIDGFLMTAIVPETELMAQAGRSTFLTVLIVAILLSLLIVYKVILRRDQCKHPVHADDFQKLGPFYRNCSIEAKLRYVALFGVIAVFASTFYLQTLSALSRQSMISETKLEAVEEILTDNNARIDELTEEYNVEYAQRARNIAWTLAQEPALVDDACLTELAKRAQISAIYVFDKNGRTTATNTSYKDFVLSEDETNQSYPFWAVVRGYMDELVQSAQLDDSMLHNYIQYVGVKRLDAEGMVQIGLLPRRIANRLQTTELDYVLSNIAVENNGMLFAVNAADQTFLYHPVAKHIGKEMTQYGLGVAMLRDGYAGYQTIDDVGYFVTSMVWDDSVICVAVPLTTIYAQRMSTSLWATGISAVIILLMCAFLVLGGKPSEDAPEASTVEQKVKPTRFFRLFQANGSSRIVQSAASRWSDMRQPWSDKSPEQKMVSIASAILSVAVIGLVCWIWLFKADPERGSIVSYILDMKWEKGLNLFSVTYAVIKMLEVLVITGIARRVITFALSRLGARSETIGRMLDSFIKYAAIISVFYYCLSAMGVDSTTLVTSAGILSLVVGLGSQKLIGDIVAGIFIVLEGEFRVGDIVTIGDWRGTVLEIGIRTTKIEDAGSDIKIINNSAITGVVNMTKQYSFAYTDVIIEKGESMERVEEALAKELPLMRQRLPAIVNGPFNKGIVSLGTPNVNIRVAAQCHEKDRVQLIRDLNHELRMVMEKYEINVKK